MMIVIKAIKQYAKKRGKRCSKEFIEMMNVRCYGLMETAIRNSRNFATLKACDLMSTESLQRKK